MEGVLRVGDEETDGGRAGAYWLSGMGSRHLSFVVVAECRRFLPLQLSLSLSFVD